ncbi:hypothetical protein J7M23_11220, partial [Candidatus Sumerlaeota bacterium]|nr:hypothetical protein [Candidatus Sumerlaeota bacterium]
MPPSHLDKTTPTDVGDADSMPQPLRISLKIGYLSLIILISLVLFKPGFGVCVDDTGDEISEDEFLDFILQAPSRLDSLPQKITKTVQGITFTSDYDNGSLEDVTSGGLNVFDCTIYEEPGALGSRKYWFRFKMMGVAGRTITLNIEHTQNLRPVISLDG